MLRLLAEGLDNNEIGLRLYLSPTTVKRHISAIFAKLGVSNRVQAAIWAVRAGFCNNSRSEPERNRAIRAVAR